MFSAVVFHKNDSPPSHSGRGKTVKEKVGREGFPNHLAGMKKHQPFQAVTTQPDSAMFSV